MPRIMVHLRDVASTRLAPRQRSSRSLRPRRREGGGRDRPAPSDPAVTVNHHRPAGREALEDPLDEAHRRAEVRRRRAVRDGEPEHLEARRAGALEEAREADARHLLFLEQDDEDRRPTVAERGEVAVHELVWLERIPRAPPARSGTEAEPAWKRARLLRDEGHRRTRDHLDGHALPVSVLGRRRRAI